MWGRTRHWAWVCGALMGCGAQVVSPSDQTSGGTDGSSAGPSTGTGSDGTRQDDTGSSGESGVVSLTGAGPTTSGAGDSSSEDGGSSGGGPGDEGSSSGSTGSAEEGSSSTGGSEECDVPDPPHAETVVDAAGTLRADRAAVVDVNGDDHLDLVTASGEDGDEIAVYLGDGTGALTFHSSVSTPVGVVRIAAGRVDNGDDDPDLITLGGLGDVTVWLNDSTGVFSGMAIDYYPSVDMATADFDGNGLLDAAVVPNTSEIPLGESKIGIFLADGATSIALDPTFYTGADFVTVVTADFDGDDNHDLFTSSGDLHLGDGTGDFGAAQSFSVGPGGVGLAAAVGDLDGDDDIDVAVVDLSFVGFTISLAELINDGTADFAAPVSTTFEGNTFGIVDVNDDGRNDVVFPQAANPFIASPPGLGIWPRDLCGGWAPEFSFSPIGNQDGALYPNTFVHGDLDEDGIPDLVVPGADDQTFSVFLSG